MIYVDRVHISAKAGDGGNGRVSFHREKFVQAGGPDGGDGGNGGDLIFVASERLHTLMDFKAAKALHAESGSDGQSGFRRGRRGADLIVEVPVGTLALERSTGRVLLDMSEPNGRRVLLRGGKGGWGNARFATPKRRAPGFAKPGEKAVPVELTLEIKSIADVGLVGLPNAGKSSILAATTMARPKIADYRFTTLSPNLGVVRRGETEFVLADIPGLVEGASEGVGLGHDFLRHVERTRLLIHVIDLSGVEGRDPLEDYEAIRAELANYGDLRSRPTIVAGNKLDLPGASDHAERFRDAHPGVPLYPVSAATREGLPELIRAVADALRDIPRPAPFEEYEPTAARSGPSFAIERIDGGFRVTGPAAERIAASTNFEDSESAAWFHKTLRRLGAIDALREAGAAEGDNVVFGGVPFEFME